MLGPFEKYVFTSKGQTRLKQRLPVRFNYICKSEDSELRDHYLITAGAKRNIADVTGKAKYHFGKPR